MNTNELLTSVESRLVAAGVRDLKFCFNFDVKSRPASEVKQDAAAILEAYLNGSYTEAQPAGELHLKSIA
jgi:hypothetical protein